ncbi:MAG: helix-hairpin-helix domain-containing protein [Lachnospiraceae bacterium]|nr:helix-hairpin-helix domain-containing protein [Lachnospiraceae bacterium]
MKEKSKKKCYKALGKMLFIVLLLVMTTLVNGCKSGSEATLEELLSKETGTSQSAMEGERGGMGNQAADATEHTVWIHMCGEVAVPGMYELPAGSRIYDGLVAAGGFTDKADTAYCNLAENVSDGMQVVIPEKDLTEAGAGTLSKTKEDGLININTATLQELQTLPGIGESRATDIIAYREKHGGFTKIEQIMEVSGIKNAVFEKIKNLIKIK